MKQNILDLQPIKYSIYDKVTPADLEDMKDIAKAIQFTISKHMN